MASSTMLRRTRPCTSFARRLAPLTLLLVPVACFNPPTASTNEGGSSSGTPPMTSSEGGTTMVDPSNTTGVDPDTGSTGPSVDDTTTDGGGTTTTGPGRESSSGEPEPLCGDGTLDPATEACDDGNRVAGDLCDSSCQVETVTFTYTGMPQSLELPPWVGEVTIEAWGAQGGGSPCCDGPDQDDGGLGGYTTGTVPVAPGAMLTVFVGGQGAVAGPGGFNGGGDGGTWGAGGGGASDVRVGAPTLVNRVLVAGGGGGGNCGCPDHGEGGAGGGLMGSDGIALQGLPAGGGGTQTAGGIPGGSGLPGVLGDGGDHAAGDSYHYAGGGGGYYGGGSAYASGGGGGSSYYGMAPGGATMPGLRPGDGEVIITPVAAP
ncbi:MAG: glycine-rich protein [Nannocystaceae bacterium]